MLVSRARFARCRPRLFWSCAAFFLLALGAGQVAEAGAEPTLSITGLPVAGDPLVQRSVQVTIANPGPGAYDHCAGAAYCTDLSIGSSTSSGLGGATLDQRCWQTYDAQGGAMPHCPVPVLAQGASVSYALSWTEKVSRAVSSLYAAFNGAGSGNTPGLPGSYPLYTAEWTWEPPPDTTIDSGPTGVTETATPTFTFHSSAADSTFECRFDSAPFEPCSDAPAANRLAYLSAVGVGTTGSETPSTALSDGPHTFSARATDRNGTDPTPGTLEFRVATCKRQVTVVASITTAWPNPIGNHCWAWFRIPHNYAAHDSRCARPRPQDRPVLCGCNYSGDATPYYWAFNDTSTEGGSLRARRDRNGIKACHARYGGKGSVFLSYHPSGGWPFTGHEPRSPKNIIEGRYMEMYTGQNLADAPYRQWVKHSSKYSPVVNVGALTGPVASELLKYCKATTRFAVYAGGGEVHDLARARAVYNALDACTGGSHKGP
jgi:hypothetical protein